MKKTAIIYGELKGGIQKKAIEVMSGLLLEYTKEYPACFAWDSEIIPSDALKIYIGTAGDNPFIKRISASPLTNAEEYCIRVINGDAYIEGADAAGVLYGCIDFYNKYLLQLEHPDDPDNFSKNPLESPLPDFELNSRPAVKNRGIWTWGHVIYDYRSFIDNMVMLKLNTVTIWNDFLPINAREMADYAHFCGIKLFWGFSWCWDTDCAEFSLDTLADNAEYLAEKYEREYSASGADGIYFQSCTELKTETLGGKIIAEAVAELVNKTADLIFKKHPDTELQFGLHATSVKNRLQFIKNIDSRIRIVWEDCGSFPFSYIPKAAQDFEETKRFAEKIAVLRGENDKFGAVTKGFTKLDWGTFEHLSGAVSIGGAPKAFKTYRAARKRRDWKYIQACWLSNAEKAHEAVRAMAEIKHGDLYITPLVEDGMFEENIMYPVALFSEMLWDTDTPTSEMMTRVALRNYVDFA